jgi:hypothetical protein
MAQFIPGRNVGSRAELTRMTLLQSEIEIAFSYLRLAGVETRDGSAAHAAELIARAILVHKTVFQDLGDLSTEFKEEKRELDRCTRELLEAIHAVEREFRML